MLTPAFVGVFGDPDDETTADAEGILHIANRLMDYLERSSSCWSCAAECQPRASTRT